ncbi:MAG: T9SS type A sorting domain-containing protein [Chlorobi bacterium]|nr:T9SS type A sorting domain-containing protein [Chlorobiota bacterium]
MRYLILFIALWALQYSAIGQDYVIINDPVYGGHKILFPDTTITSFTGDGCNYSTSHYFFDLDQDSSADLRFYSHCFEGSEGGSHWLALKPLGNFQVMSDTSYIVSGQYIDEHVQLHDTLYHRTIPYKFLDGDTITADMLTDTNVLKLYVYTYSYIPYFIFHIKILHFHNDTSYIAFKKTDGDKTWIYYLKIYLSIDGFKLMAAYSNEPGVGIEKPSKYKNYIYPNPVLNKANINGDFEQIEIFSLQGALLLTKDISVNKKTLDLSGLKQGLYFVRLKSATGEVVQKIIKN